MIKLLVLLTGLFLLIWEHSVWASDTAQIKPSMCVNCHDSEIPNNEVQVPSLAGQNSLYLTKQINLFRSSRRVHPMLSANSQALSNDEIVGLATYYANLQPKNSKIKLNAEGDLMYSACSGCHGDEGEGVAPFPRLIGQNTAYLEQQLINFKTGVRANGVMQAMTINLSDQEIKTLAAYLGSPKQAN